RGVILGMGAHPIKVGLSPVIIDLMERGVITAVALNGACLVHDFELAYTGATSEDVGPGLRDGSFGMAEETGKFLNLAIREAAATGATLDRGVFVNLGSAVVIPEVFVKALNVARNLGNKVGDLTTIDMDFI